MMEKEFFTAAELAGLKLPGLPDTKQGINARAKTESWSDRQDLAGRPLARRRQGRGGGMEYSYRLLPGPAQARIVALHAPKAEAIPLAASRADLERSEAWRWYDALPEKKKAEARRRLAALDHFAALKMGGTPVNLAARTAAAQHGAGRATLFNWLNLVAGLPRADWLPALAPRQAGAPGETADCSPEAWEMLVGDYLRLERPTFKAAYWRVQRAAQANGWTLPCAKTLERRLHREVAAPVIVLARQGLEALKRMYPAQERDRGVFHALEAVNADFHTFDVFVKWPDGTVGRPSMVAFQDLYSGLFLSWRLDLNPNKEAVRLAFGDLVETYGIPEHCWLDNGREFAAKWLTGGTQNRYRFKVREEEPLGLLTALGVEIHWTTPYHGQAKPIERAFRDMCDTIARHPACAGAYTGNNPMAKPENYGSKAVPLDKFVQVLEEEIAAHNARPGRRAAVCAGRSFGETFRASYESSPIRQALPEQRRLWLLAAEGITARKPDGALHLQGNRYWGGFLAEWVGHSLVARFDPQDLQSGLHVYRLDGAYLGFADCIEAAGFADVNKAREHASARKKYLRGVKDQLAAVRKLDPDQVAALMPAAAPTPDLERRVVQMVTALDTPIMRAPAPKPQPLTDSQQAQQVALLADFQARREAPRAETPEDRFARALKALADQAAGRPLDAEAARWLAGYTTTAEYKARRLMLDDAAAPFAAAR
jgi:hypothetical protein